MGKYLSHIVFKQYFTFMIRFIWYFTNNCLPMKTINDLIKELQKLDPKQKKLPFVLYDIEHNQEFNIIEVEVSDKDRIDLNLM